MNPPNTLRRLAASLFLLAGSVAAQERAPAPSYDPTPFREYGWVEFGYAHVPAFDATLSSVSSNGVVNQDLRMEMGPGFAVHGGLGESFSRWISAELLGGIYYHNVDEVSGADGAGRGFDASLLQVPIMVNLVVHVPLRSRLTPVLGGGAGAVISWLDVENQLPIGGGNVLQVNGSSTEVTFAYQAFAGLRYQYGDGAVVSLTYRLTGVGSPTWGLDDADTGDSVANLKAHDLLVHSLTLGFHISF
jgi:opacity protein-like surface antigen